MKLLSMLILTTVFAASAAAMTWNESVNGEFSADPAAPTPVVFSPLQNVIIGTLTTGDRDYITFTLPSGSTLTYLNLEIFSPDNTAFASFNSGATSYIPSAATDPNFLSGIHVTAADIGDNLLPWFVTRNVTTNHLPEPNLGPGTYCFLMQQTSSIVLQNYMLEFDVLTPLPAEASTWGAIKALYR